MKYIHHTILRCVFTISLVLLLLVPNVFSQQVRTITKVAGLDQSQAFNFFQDKEGFMWISTKFGVNRFDGKNIKTYPLEILNSARNPMREVHLISDKDSVLWAYTDNGMIKYYDERNDRFLNYTNVKSYLKTVFIDNENTLWLGQNFALGRVINRKLTVFKHQKLEFTMVRKILPLNKNELIIVTSNSVLLFNKTTCSLKELNGNITERVATFQIETAYFDNKKQHLWLGTSNKGIILYDHKTGVLNENIFKSLDNNPVFSIHPVDNNYLFIGTDAMGIVLFNNALFRIERIHTQRDNNQHGVTGIDIYDIFKDKEGRYWLSTYSGGVSVINPQKEGFNALRNDPNNPNSLTENAIHAILTDRDQNIWFGSNSGISVWDKRRNYWKKIQKPKNILALFQDSKQQIWVGTYASGVYVLDKNGTIKKHIFKSKFYDNTLGTNFIYSIFEDSNGNIWLGGSKGPLTKYNPANNTFKQIPVYQINNIIQRNANELLIAATNGLYQLWLNNDQSRLWPHSPKLKSLYVYDLLPESDSTVWITSYGSGLGLCNLKTGKIDYFTQKDGLASDISYSILKDNKENLWISGENGLSKMNIKTKSIINFNTGDGISDMAFCPLSRAVNAGEFFFGSERGITYFKPENIEPKITKSMLALTAFSLFNQVTHPNDKNSPLKDKINNLKTIELGYRDHSFSINFTTINFSQNANQHYIWKLEGLDKDWVGPSTETVVNYTNLSPKTYIFKVRAIGNNNTVLDERELKIVINPPFWNTIVFRLVLFVLLALFGYWAYNYLSNIYEKRRTNEKIKFFINTTHDLRTPLTLISSPIYELKEKLVLDQWNRYLFELVTSNIEKMNKMVSQLLDFQKSYESEERLIVTKNNLNELLTEKKLFWEPVAQHKSISLQLVLPESPLFEWYDRHKMDKIIDNLISNALKYSRNDGQVTIQLSFTQSYWQINVIDKGIGIPESASKQLFRRFFRAENAINFQETGSGLGLLLVKNYVSLHKGKTGVRSKENEGSDFYIRLKRGNKHFKPNEIYFEPEFLNTTEANDDIEIYEKQKTRLLIVEDNTDLRDYMSKSLSNYFTTYTAVNGKDAWDKILTINPDIVMSDYNMPEMNGFELCEKIKKTYETSHIPVILLTVVSDNKTIEEGIRIGADDYIPKPFDVKFLKLKIDNLIANRKILRTKFLKLANMTDDTAYSENDLNSEFISKSTKIVEAHMTDKEFSITDFSREMGMSKSLLYTKFNAITGYSPNDFVKIIRMKKAVALLKEGVHNINEISMLTGFDEPSYFTKCFKKIYGKTPKQYIAEI